MNHAEFTTHVVAQLQQAFTKFNITTVNVKDVSITYNIKGRIVGKAGTKTNWSTRTREYYLKFNPQAMLINLKDMLEDTIPHEIAHLICFIRPELGKHHDSGWKNVCQQLGGSPTRCYQRDTYEGLAPARQVKRYTYNVHGEIITVGPKHHAQIQKGRVMRLKSTGKQVQPHMLVVNVASPVLVQAPIPTASKPIQKSTGMTKTAQAAEIYKQHPKASRAELIQMFMTELNMSKAGAQTYYYNLKK